MKNIPMLHKTRNRERGAVAIIVAFTWTALFGAAVLAIDFGYLYAKRRGVQAAADATLRITMKTWMQSGYSAATGQATTVAGQLGYNTAADTVTTSQDTVNNLFTVKISRVYPTFFAGLFGMNGKAVSGTATGKMTVAPSAGATIQALNGAVCGAFPTWGVGFMIQGAAGTSFTVNGSVESGTQVALQTGSGSITGGLKTDCPTPLPTGGGNFNAASATITGGETTIASGGGVITDSIALTVAMLEPTCTVGSLFNPAFPGIAWIPGAGCDTPPDEIYCSQGNITVAPITPGVKTICPGSRATFISQGAINFGADDGINLRPSTRPAANATAARLVAASFAAAGGPSCMTQDILFGSSANFALGDATNDAYVYAPNGCISAGGGASGFTFYGKIVAQNIAFSPSPGLPWVFTGSGGRGRGAREPGT